MLSEIRTRRVLFDPLAVVCLLGLLLGAPDSYAQTLPIVVATIDVGNFPFGVAANPFTNRIYVASRGAGVSVIDRATNAVVATIPVTRAFGVGVNPATDRVYVTHVSQNGITFIDGASNTVVTSFAGGGLPQRVGVNPFTDLIYAASRPNDTLSVIAELPPPALILRLMDNVVSLNLPQGIENSLDAKLNAALKQLDENSESNAVAALSAPEDTSENCNNVAACNILEAFINAVEAQSAKKIPVADADALVAAAIEIILLLCLE